MNANELYNVLADRIDEEVDSIAMRNKLFSELDMADRLGVDTEEGQWHLRRVENTLDTLDTDD